MRRQSNVLVTGDTGFIGSFLTKRLEREGYHVSGLNTLNGSIMNTSCVDKAVEGKDYVFHLAGLSRPAVVEKESFRSHLLNVRGTENIADACHHYGVKMIFTSSRLVYGNIKYPVSETEPACPVTVYGLHKHLAESFCDTHQDFIARLTAVYGPSDLCHSVICKFIKLIQSNEKIIVYKNDTSKRDYCYIDDIVDALLLGINHNGAYNVGSGVETTINELLCIISKTLEKNYEIIYEKKKSFDSERVTLDFSKIKKLGWHPKTDLKEGIRGVVEWSNQEHEGYHRIIG